MSSNQEADEPGTPDENNAHAQSTSVYSNQEAAEYAELEQELLVASIQHDEPENVLPYICPTKQKRLDSIVFEAVCPNEITKASSLGIEENILEVEPVQHLNATENDENIVSDEDDVEIIETPHETIVINDGDDDVNEDYSIKATSKAEETNFSGSSQTQSAEVEKNVISTHEFIPKIMKGRSKQELINNFANGLNIADTVDIDDESKSGNRRSEPPAATEHHSTCNVTLRWLDWTLKTNITINPQAPMFRNICNDAAWRPPKMPRAVDSVSNEFLWHGNGPDAAENRPSETSERETSRRRSHSGSNSLEVERKSNVTESIASRLRPRAASVRVPGWFPETTSRVRDLRPLQRNVGTCPLCSESLGIKSVASTICGHIFCMVCIRKHIVACRGARYCPTCKKVFKKGQTHHRLFL